MLKIYSGKDKFYQWDLDQKLIVEEPTASEVHFCNGLQDCSLTCEVYEESEQRVVDVPNILFTNHLPIKAYLYDGCCTRHDVTFTVERRSKPSDYVYTETEVRKVEDAVASALESVIEDTENMVAEAIRSVELTAVKQTTYSTTPYNPTFQPDKGDCARAYVRNNDNTEGSILISKYLDAFSLPLRNIDGNLLTGSPKGDNECANRKYVDDINKTLTASLLKFKRATVSPNGGTFALKPGMLAIVFPWNNSSCSLYSSTGVIYGSIGTSVMFTTDRNGSSYDLAAINLNGLSTSSHHNTYTVNSSGSNSCYIKNNYSPNSGETGFVYVYYLERR